MTDINPTLDPVSNRAEIVFLFDATDANPNGDPLTEENRPRIDEASQQAIVSDVRIKRTIRDFLDQQGYPIFIKAAGEEEGLREDKNDRFGSFEPLMRDYVDGDYDEATNEELEEAFLAVATDVRMFGDSMAFDTANDTEYLTSSYTGPIQFGFARSLNKVEVAHHGKTSVLAASSEDQQNIGGNMYTEHRLPYALFAAHGVVNEHAAADTLLSAEDVELASAALWEGTHGLNSSSKMGIEPRVLLRVTYAEEASHIGDLHRELELTCDAEESFDIRDIEEAVIDIDDVISSLDTYSDQIERISGRLDRRVRFQVNGEEHEADSFEGILADHVGESSTHLTTV